MTTPIPSYIAEIADLLQPSWATLPEIVAVEILALAWKIYKAGYRKVAEPVT